MYLRFDFSLSCFPTPLRVDCAEKRKKIITRLTRRKREDEEKKDVGRVYYVRKSP